MLKLAVFTILQLAIVQVVQCALPPLYQSSNEIKEILNSKDLDQYLTPADAIVSIQKNKTGYEIISNLHQIQADIIYEPSEMPGPTKFKVVFQKARSIQQPSNE